MRHIVYNAQGYAEAIWPSDYHRVCRLHNRSLIDWKITAHDLATLPDVWATICSGCGLSAARLVSVGPRRRICSLCDHARRQYAAAG